MTLEIVLSVAPVILFYIMPVFLLWLSYRKVRKEERDDLIPRFRRALGLSSIMVILFLLGFHLWHQFSPDLFMFPRSLLVTGAFSVSVHILIWAIIVPPIMTYSRYFSTMGKELFPVAGSGIRTAQLKSRRTIRVFSHRALLFPYCIALCSLAYIGIRLLALPDIDAPRIFDLKHINYSLFFLIGFGFLIYNEPRRNQPIPGQGVEAESFAKELEALMRRRLRLYYKCQLILTSISFLIAILQLETDLNNLPPAFVLTLIPVTYFGFLLVFLLTIHKRAILWPRENKLDELREKFTQEKTKENDRSTI